MKEGLATAAAADDFGSFLANQQQQGTQFKRTKSISGASIFKQSLAAKITGSKSAPSFLNLITASAQGVSPLESMQEYQHVNAAEGVADELVVKDHTYGFLVLEDKKGKEKEYFPMSRSVISMGRALENDVRFLKAEVSRVHCRITFSEDTGEASIQVLGLSGIELNGIHEKASASSIPLCEGDLICLAKRFFRVRYPNGMFAPLPKRVEEPQAVTEGEVPAKENVGTPARRRVRMSLVAAAEVYSPPPPAALPSLAPSFAHFDSPRYVAPEQSIRVISSSGSGSDHRAEDAEQSFDHRPVPRQSLSPRKSALASPTKESGSPRKAKRASFAPVLEMGPTGSPLLGPQGFLGDDYFGKTIAVEKEEEVNDLVLIEEVEEEEGHEQEEHEEILEEAHEEVPSAPATPAPLTPSLSPRKSGRKVSLRTETLLKTSGSAFRLSMPEIMLTPRHIPLPPSLPGSPAAIATTSSLEEEHSDADEEDEVDRSLSFADSPARASSGFSGERHDSQEADEEPAARQPLGAFMTPQVRRTKSVLNKPRGRVSLGGADGLTVATPKRSRRSFVRSFSFLREEDGLALESEPQHEDVHQQLTDRLQELEEAAEDALTDEEEAGVGEDDAQPAAVAEDVPAEAEEVPIAGEAAVPDEPVTADGDEHETQFAESHQLIASESTEAGHPAEEESTEHTTEQPTRCSQTSSKEAVEERIIEVAAPAEDVPQEDAQADGQSVPMPLEGSSESKPDAAEASAPSAKKPQRAGRRGKTIEAAKETTEAGRVELPPTKKATRGRKAKASTPEDSTTDAKPTEEVKAQEETNATEGTAEAVPDAPLAPKKATRGRKPKDSAVEVATSEAEPAAEVKEESAKVPRKKAAARGKKAVKAADEEVDEAAEEKTASVEQPRSRAPEKAAPKKTKESEPEAGPLSDAIDSANVMPSSEADFADNETSSPVKKVSRGGKRGAAKKAASAISDIASGVPMTTDAEGNLVAVDDENLPAIKTRSTRASARTTRSRRA